MMIKIQDKQPIHAHNVQLFCFPLKKTQNTDFLSCQAAATVACDGHQHGRPTVSLTCEYDVGQSSAAVGVQHVGPHLVLQIAMAATQACEGSLGVVEQGGGGRGGGRVEARTPRRGAHRVFQQIKLVQLAGRWRRENGKRQKKMQRISERSCRRVRPRQLDVFTCYLITSTVHRKPY